MDFSILINWMSPFPVLGVSGVLFSVSFYFLYEFILANSVDVDAASDLGLHCLPRSKKRDSRLTWVNIK